MLPRFLPVGESFTLSHSRIGNESQPLVVMRDFLRDVDWVREHAIKNADFKKADEFYPGVRMAVPGVYRESLLFHLGESLSSFFDIGMSDIQSVKSTYSIVSTPVDKLQFIQKIPHFDVPLTNGIAVLHYLCDFPGSGTSFYRHRDTGYEYIDETRSERYFETLHKQYAGKQDELHGFINGSTEEYEQIASQAVAYNKLLMYRGSSLHSGDMGVDYGGDDSPATGRLTITSFIQAK